MALRTDEKAKLVKDFGASAQDTGSTEVQIALLSESIKQLTEHCQTHPKDVSTKRGLLKKVCERRGFLKYLQRKDLKKYQAIVIRLGLKK